MRIAFFIFIIVLLTPFAVMADMSGPCQDQLTHELAQLIRKDHKNILKLQFEITTLKITRAVLNAHKTTLEMFLKEKVEKIDIEDDGVRKKLNDLYTQYGKTADLDRLNKLVSEGNYYDKSKRWQNSDLTLFLLTESVVNDHQVFPVDEKDAAITWFYSEVQKKFKPFSMEYNLFNLSNQLAQDTGAVDPGLKLSPAQVDEKLRKDNEAIGKEFQNMTTVLVNNKDHACHSEWQETLCKDPGFLASIFPKSLLELKDLSEEFTNIPQKENKSSATDFKQQVTNKTVANVNTVKKNVSTTNFQISYGNKGPVKVVPQDQSNGLFSYFYNFKTSYEDFDVVKVRQNNLNKLDERQKIVNFNKGVEKQNYVILDKENGLLTIYSPEGKVLSEFEVGVGEDRTDFVSEKNQKSTPAGIYSIAGQNGSTLSLKNEKGVVQNFKIKETTSSSQGRALANHNTGDNHFTGGNVAVTGSEIKSMNKFLVMESKFYVLPEEKGNTFAVKNGKLNFTTYDNKNYAQYNYSPKSQAVFKTEFSITDPSMSNKISEKFVQTLEDEKATLMKLYGLDNDEYNELARVAFGILGRESKLGTSTKLGIKEMFPLFVAWGKGNSTTNENSRGLTQMKSVPKKIQDHYGIKHENMENDVSTTWYNVGALLLTAGTPVRAPTITGHQLNSARNAALSTMGFLAEALADLKVREKTFKKITPENRYDYLQYIYRGATSQIINGTATPETNKYLNGMKVYMSKLKIYQAKVASN